MIFSPLQQSVSLAPLPPAPMTAMFNLLFKFCARSKVGTPKTTAPEASVAVLRKLRRWHRGALFFGGCMYKEKNPEAPGRFSREENFFLQHKSPHRRARQHDAYRQHP